MADNRYDADTENGDHVADPSEDALLALINGLNPTDNTFVTIVPADDSWYASVSLLTDGSYEVERNDPDQQTHERTTGTDPGKIAKDLTAWLDGRN